MAASISNCGLVWIPASGGESVPDAIVAGKSRGGAEIHILKGDHQDETAVGKLEMGLSTGHLPYRGQEIPIEEYHILANPGGIELEWVPAERGHVPTGAVEVGMSCIGDPFYIARLEHNSDLIPGKLLPHYKCTYFSWGGKEHWRSTYEVLCIKKLKVEISE